ncbi:MAG: hypothetical protein A3J00_01855 [Candidatus Niyogibacteria bacterium RIFCSPLOWO2_02_FULL_45_13]|uniref:Uncharacterized protein n=1 Tax=Candidatus Niyogibacteria bacterium RIFCSPLOWO2_02_FULL_45_13 TaxID=1801725 RepID=A0A1G2EZJ0_9BACT|nr:MAG: hypothetical protein A3J00_01855 [Candidatus Niyogibacteria bacterium RIFCSPLOWO2_02_FULL_45_13]
MAKAAADGQMVNIPSPPRFLTERRRKQERAHYWICVSANRIVLQANPENGRKAKFKSGKTFRYGRKDSFEEPSQKTF